MSGSPANVLLAEAFIREVPGVIRAGIEIYIERGRSETMVERLPGRLHPKPMKAPCEISDIPDSMQASHNKQRHPLNKTDNQ